MRLLPLSTFLAFAATALAQPTPPVGTNPMQRGTTPGANNDTSIRELTPEEVYPNLNFYAVNPLYREGTPLGWAKERIEEKIDRGVVALAAEDKKVYVSWRLLRTDPAEVAFNVYRSTAGGAPVKLNAQPLAKTCDLVDTTAPLDQANTWSVRAVVAGRELEASPVAALGAGAAPQQYRAIKLKDDVTSISMSGIL